MQITHYTESYREKSEDRSAIIGTVQGPVLVVADGVGGQPGGGAAAERAVEMVRDAVNYMKIDKPIAWYHCLKGIDAALQGDEALGQTTLVVVAVTPRWLVGASAGDSEAWLIRADGHYPLTGGQVRKPYLGSGAEPVPFQLRRPESGTLLLATDGLFKYAPEEKILVMALHPNLDEVGEGLADLARLSNGKLPDDLALVLCRFSRLTFSPLTRLKQWLTPPRPDGV